MNLTDSFAFASRKIAQTKLHKLSEALRRYYPVKSGLTTIHNFDGDLKICLDRASYLSSVIYWRGYNSTSIASFLKNYLRPDMTFVDVGANLGEVTLLAAKRLTKGRVLAFEPMPLTFSQLSRNIAVEVVMNQFNVSNRRLNEFVALKGRFIEGHLLRHDEFRFHRPNSCE